MSNYQQLYDDVEAITGAPDEFLSSDIRSALLHLKALVDLPDDLSQIGEVAMYYLGITDIKLRDAQAMIARRSLEYLKARKMVHTHIERLVGTLPDIPEIKQPEGGICRLCD